MTDIRVIFELDGCEHLKEKKKEKVTGFWFRFNLPTQKRSNTMVEITITNEQKVKATLNPVTATGRPAKLDGAPKWVVSSGDATVVPAADGLSCELVSGDNPGDTVILVSADADLGSGVVTISDSITLHVQGALATNLGLTVGTPEAK